MRKNTDNPIRPDVKWLLLPTELLQLRNPMMEKGWIERENLLCRRLVFYSSQVLSASLLIFLYLDSLRPQFDLQFALAHRLGGLMVFVGLALMIGFDLLKSYKYGFVVYKSIFIVGSLYISFFQIQLMFSNSDIPRLYPQLVLVGAAGILNMGFRSSLIFSIFHTILLVSVGVLHLEYWAQNERYISDLSFQVAAILLIYILTSRYSLAVKLHISNFMREEAARNRVDHAYLQMTKLVLPHVVDKINMGYHIEDTMPVGSDQALVICFDIVSSSQIEHKDFYKKLEIFQACCFDLMNQNYDPASLESEAYRIKELGDGFLCSVNFPLKVPQADDAAALAHRLVREFLRAFDQHMESLRYHKPILAGVGIAYGPIEGYFPTSGPKQYDLRGRSIILATRYQELRKILDDQRTQSEHVIIISRLVYQQLPEYLKGSYQRKALNGIRVRDDQAADEIFVALIPPTVAGAEMDQAV